MSAQPSNDEIGRTLHDLAELGPGWSGTPGEERRREYVRRRLKDTGHRVEIEEFDYLCADPNATASCQSSILGELPNRPVQYTAAETAKGRLVAVGQARDEDFAALDAAGTKLDGAICLVRAFAPFAAIPALAQLGAAGVIVQAETADDLIPHYAGRPFPAPLAPPWKGAYSPIPAVTVAKSTGDLLLAAHASGAGTVTVRHDTSYAQAASANVVASDGEETEHLIALVAHYDTQLEGGVWDNSTGLAVLIELARLAPQLRSETCGIRFIAVGCEEQLMWGSHHYAQRHQEELRKRCLAMMNWDSPSAGYPVKNTCWCSETMRFLCDQAADAASWPIHVWGAEDFALSDTAPFAHIGIPTIWFWQYPPVHPYYHTARDTLELIDLGRLTEVARVGAHALELLANAGTAAP